MKKNSLLLVMIVMFMQLVGCTSHVTTQPAPPVIEKSEPVAPPVVKQPEKPVEPIAPPQAVPKTQASVPTASSNATASLVSQARAQYQAKNYQGAVATAERALRIDRRSPEVYLILAQSYIQLANKQLAMQFVQQGIRYSQAGTELAQALVQVRDSIQK